MLSGEAESVIQIGVVKNDMAMQVVFIVVDSDNIKSDLIPIKIQYSTKEYQSPNTTETDTLFFFQIILF